MRCWVWVVRPDQFRKCRWRPRPAFGGGWFKWVSQIGCDLLKKSVIVKCTIIESSVHRRPWTDARLDTYNWYRILFFGPIRARHDFFTLPCFQNDHPWSLIYNVKLNALKGWFSLLVRLSYYANHRHHIIRYHIYSCLMSSNFLLYRYENFKTIYRNLVIRREKHYKSKIRKSAGVSVCLKGCDLIGQLVTRYHSGFLINGQVTNC